MEEVECVYHGDKYAFGVAMDELRKAGLFKRHQTKIMAMVVCSCRKKVSHRQPISEDQARQAADHLLLLLPTPSPLPLLDQLTPSTRDLVTSAARHARRLPTLTSQTRLTVLLSQALQQDFQLLEEESAHVLRRSQGKDPTSSKPKQQKLSSDIVKKIVKKKKSRYTERFSFTLPLFGGSTHQLYQNSSVGDNFAKLGRQFSCVLEIDGEATAARMAANAAETVVKAWCSNLQSAREAAKVLTAVASEIQTRSAERWRERRKAQQRFMKSLGTYVNYEHNNNNNHHRTEDYKVFLTQDFEKKMHKKQRNGSKSAHSHKRPTMQRDDGSSIAQGHCLHCLLPFTIFKAEAERNNDVKLCRHHPGYVTGRKWTCCLKDSDSQHPTHEEHAQSGCMTGRHIFRPHKKAARGVGAKAYHHQRCFRQRKLTLEPRVLRPLIY